MFQWNQFSLPDAISPVIEEFLLFHDYLIIILIFTITRVLYFITTLFLNSFINQKLIEGQSLEFIWTIIPAIILTLIALPSLTLLYRLDSSSSSSLTIKVIGHQWYWSYEYTDFWNQSQRTYINFDAYIIPRNSLEEGIFRLLETDNRPALPYLTNLRILIRRSDVLHSWTIPSIGVKLDATPGRLNQTSIVRYRPGVAYGQCSEICGANHRFMPINIEFINIKDFLLWIELDE